MDELLALPASKSSLGRLFPVVVAMRHVDLSCASKDEVRYILRTFASFAFAATRKQALTFLSPVIEAALELVQSELDQNMSTGEVGDHVAVKRYISRHYQLIKALVNQRDDDGQSRMWASEHSLVVQEQCGRVVQHLITKLESFPSSSDVQQANMAMMPEILDHLLSPKLLVPATVELLLAHCRLCRVDLTPVQWRDAAATLFRAGNTTRAIACLAQASTGGDKVSDSHRLMAAQGARTFEDALQMLAPVVSTSTPAIEAPKGESPSGDDDNLARAWSILATQAARDSSLPAADIASLAKAIPSQLQTTFIVTPTLHGLVKRGDTKVAKDIWKGMLHRHEHAEPEQRGYFLDAAGLTVGAELLFVEAARVGQTRATRESEPQLTFNVLRRPFKLVDILGSRTGSSHHRPSPVHSIPLDSRVLGVMMWMCVRSGSPGPAFRLWEAACPRWRVEQDDATLALLLDCSRLCADNGFDAGLDTFRGRLKALASAIKPPKIPQPQVVNWRQVPFTALLDPPRYSWHAEHGVQPWQKARDLFRSIVLSNWPTLATIPSPLEHGSGPIGVVADFISPRSTPPNPQAPLPSPTSKYLHLVPGSASWASFIFLLEHHAAEWDDKDVAQALGWMRALGVRPTWRAMATALMHIGEVEGPRRRVRIRGNIEFARDEEIMRAWLSEWVGNVPTEEQVAAFRRVKIVERAEAHARKRGDGDTE